eukprot:g71398.t1
METTNFDATGRGILRWQNPKFCKAWKCANMSSVDGVRARIVLANASMEWGAASASRIMGVSRGKARHWETKALDPDFHPRRHGGRTYSTLPRPDQIALEWACYFMWRSEPGLTDAAVVQHLRDLGWTWKASVTNPEKYTDPSRLKYLDESHFENWDCSRWQWLEMARSSGSASSCCG